MGHTVFNYGMYSAEDEHQLTYVQNGILAAVSAVRLLGKKEFRIWLKWLMHR